MHARSGATRINIAIDEIREAGGQGGRGALREAMLEVLKSCQRGREGERREDGQERERARGGRREAKGGREKMRHPPDRRAFWEGGESTSQGPPSKAEVCIDLDSVVASFSGGFGFPSSFHSTTIASLSRRSFFLRLWTPAPPYHSVFVYSWCSQHKVYWLLL